MRRDTRPDAGQAFPIYIMMVAGLLFLALAFFAVGKASALRNEAQGAADASALAAGQSAREQFEAPFIEALWTDSLGVFLGRSPSSAGARQLRVWRPTTTRHLRAVNPPRVGSVTPSPPGWKAQMRSRRLFCRGPVTPTRRGRQPPSLSSGANGRRWTSTRTAFRTSTSSPATTERWPRFGQAALRCGPA